jgi:hypothetical protein
MIFSEEEMENMELRKIGPTCSMIPIKCLIGKKILLNPLDPDKKKSSTLLFQENL